MKLKGYRRKDGKIGIRNHVLFLPTVACANSIVRHVGFEFPDVVTIEHHKGCLDLADDMEIVRRMLVGLARHPNVGAVVFVGLGCEQTTAEYLYKQLDGEKPVAQVTIQKEGGTTRALEKCRLLAKRFLEDAKEEVQEPFGLKELAIGTVCGGSDWTSAIASNPAVGVVSDRILHAGGTVFLGGTVGWFGGEEVVLNRARSEQAKLKILQLMRRIYSEAERRGSKIEESNPTPGNIAGGITTLTEKALGSIRKVGENPVEGILDMGEYPSGPGLWLLESLGIDATEVAVMAGAGAHLVLFTTGLGTPVGSPICPVIKISASPTGIKRMRENIDVDVSDIVMGDASLMSGGDRIQVYMEEVINGRLTKAELLAHREFIMPERRI
jgi:altronate dehydratase large subunit